MPKLSTIEFVRRGTEMLLERAKERFPSTMRLPAKFEGAPDIDGEIVNQLDWLFRHGVSHPLNAMARHLEKDPRALATYEGCDKPWFALMSSRIRELHTVVTWYTSVRERDIEGIAVPLFLQRLGCEDAKQGVDTCRRILRRAGLFVEAKQNGDGNG